MTDNNGVAADQLRTIVERVERLEAEKAGIQGDIKEIYAEAKANGFDVKQLRAIVRMRKQDQAQREEEEAILETYMAALGMLSDTPLGNHAAERDLGEAVRALGTPVALTDQERADGTTAAFDRGGARMSVTIPASAGPILREASRRMREISPTREPVDA